MKTYCALAILAVLVGAQAQNSDDPPCSKQMELQMRCELNTQTSPEAQMLKDRVKQTMKTCAPDYPQECHAQMEAAHECKISIAKSIDTDPLFKESKSKSQPAVDACFEKYPADIKKAFMAIFMSDEAKHGHGPKGGWNKHHKKHHNDTSTSGEQSGESGQDASGDVSGESSSSNETSAERKHGGGGGHHGGGGRHGGGGGRHGGGGGGGGGGRHGGGGKHGKGCHGKGRGGRGGRGGHGGHHGPRNLTSGESGSSSNETSSGEWGHKGGQSGESGEKANDRCQKTPEQHQCMKDELQKLTKDSALVDVINTLMHQKQKCKQVVTWSCTAKFSKRQKCVFKATKPCRQVFMEKMKTCLQEKGFTLPPFMLKEHGASMFTTPMPDIPQEQ